MCFEVKYPQRYLYKEWKYCAFHCFMCWWYLPIIELSPMKFKFLLDKSHTLHTMTQRLCNQHSVANAFSLSVYQPLHLYCASVSGFIVSNKVAF